MKPSEILAMQANLEAQPLFEQGRAAFENKDFAAARALFERALAKHPQHFDATNYLGILFAQAGQPLQAIPYFKKAVALSPNNPRAHNNLGQILDEIKDYDGAIASFDRAISLEANYEAARTNRAATLARMPSPPQTQLAPKPLPVQTIQPQPAQTQPLLDYMKMAIACYERGDKNGAFAHVDAWTRAEPKNALAHLKRGIICKELHRYHEAMDSLNAAVQLNPQGFEAFYERGDVLQYHELFELAERDFKQVIALKPTHSAGFEGLAGVQNALGHLQEALATSAQALAVNPKSANAHNLRYDLLLNLREHDLLLAESAKLIKEQPQSADVYTRRGKLLSHLRQFPAALAAFDQALNLEAGYPPAKQGKAGVLYLQGRWMDAYKANATSGYTSNHAFLQSFGKPIWTGVESVNGKTILIHAELGQGDTVQLVRFAHLAAKRGATVILKVQKSLVRLLGTLAGVSQVLAYEDPTPPFDFICSTLALPAIFGVQPNDIVFAKEPYLRVLPQWLSPVALLAKTKRRVGLVWGGGHSHYNYRRSVSLSQLMPILQRQDIEFYSFQKDRPRKDLESIQGVHIIDLAEKMKDFADTAALVSQMDLIISVDTSVAHVAGALGKPVWMLTRRDHLWLEGREDNPWYASMRMYTQTDFGAWDEVISRVQHDL